MPIWMIPTWDSVSCCLRIIRSRPRKMRGPSSSVAWIETLLRLSRSLRNRYVDKSLATECGSHRHERGCGFSRQFPGLTTSRRRTALPRPKELCFLGWLRHREKEQVIDFVAGGEWGLLAVVPLRVARKIENRPQPRPGLQAR